MRFDYLLKHRKCDVCIVLLIGICAFVFVTGGSIINPKYIDWLLVFNNRDPAQHFLGWYHFRNSPWGFPFGVNYNYGMEFSFSVVYTDSIPLFALFFKLFSPILPEKFQYFGIWILSCFLMQSFFAWLLLSKFVYNRVNAVIASAFFTLSPVMLQRLGFEYHSAHMSLAAHWFILASFCVFFSKSFSNLRWIVLAVCSVLIHSTFTPVVLVIYLCDVLYRLLWGIRPKESAYIRTLLYIRDVTILGIMVLLAMWLSGYFVPHELVDKDFNINKATLLSLFEPFTWSYLLPGKSVKFGEHEGFAFLGTGMFVLLTLFVCCRLIFKSTFLSAYRNNRYTTKVWLLFIIAMLLFIFSLGTKIDIWKFSFHFAPPISLWEYLLEQFRSHGRFVWVIHYFVFFIVLVWISNLKNWKIARCLLVFALIIQCVDSSTAYGVIKKNMINRQYKSPFVSKLWDDALNQYNKILVVIPSGRWTSDDSWADISYMAAKAHLPTNTGRISRVVPINFSSRKNDFRNSILNQLDKDALYIFNNKELDLWHMISDKNNGNALSTRIDGFYVIAPNTK